MTLRLLLPAQHQLTVVLLLLSIRLGSTVGQGAPCTICKDGEPVSLPDEILAVPGLPAMQCSSVDLTLSFVVPNATSADCETVQSLGSLCGCPTREDSCSLCPSGNSVGLPDNELPFFSDLFLGFVPTCQILEAYLSSRSADESMCFVSQSFISGYCGCDEAGAVGGEELATPCSLCPGGEQASFPDKSVSMPDLPFQTCGTLEEALEMILSDGVGECNLLSEAFASYCGCSSTYAEVPCSLCRDGSSVANPTQHVELLQEEFGGITPTCAVYESFVATTEAESRQCSNAQLLGSVCGCPPVKDHCVFCPGESMPEEYLDFNVADLSIIYDFTMTCGDAEAYLQYQVRASSDECFLAQHSNYLCGCNDGEYSYLGANTDPKKAALAWTPRISAFLSMVVSSSLLTEMQSGCARVE